MDKKTQNRRRRDNKRIHFQIKKNNDTQHNKINAKKKKKNSFNTENDIKSLSKHV